MAVTRGDRGKGENRPSWHPEGREVGEGQDLVKGNFSKTKLSDLRFTNARKPP